jgi:cAMP-dependent protein kinase regulator
MDPNRLKQIYLFQDLSDEEAKRLAAFATETSVAEGQILMKQGDYSTELIGIEEGTADVERDGQKLATLKEGDVIGEMGLLTREPRNATVIASSPMRVMKLTHWEIRRMSDETLDRIAARRSFGSRGARRLPGVPPWGAGNPRSSLGRISRCSAGSARITSASPSANPVGQQARFARPNPRNRSRARFQQLSSQKTVQGWRISEILGRPCRT